MLFLLMLIISWNLLVKIFIVYLKPIDSDNNASTSNTDRAMDGSANYKSPTNNALVINSASQHNRINYNSAPHANVPHGAASSLQHSTPPNFTQHYGTPTVNQPRADNIDSGGIKDEAIKIFRQTFGIDPKSKYRSYQRSYPNEYEYVAYPQGFKIPEFFQFTGDDTRLHWSI